MKHCLLFLFILSWAAGLCPANPVAPQRPPNRFLFILETSSEMKRLAPAAEQSVLDLVRSGMGGLMENGDTFGFWSFNDEFHSGQIPMQVWNAEQSEELTYTARAYLNSGGKEGAVVGFFSLEMSSDQLATRILSEESAVPSERIRKGVEISPIRYDDLDGLTGVTTVAVTSRRA